MTIQLADFVKWVRQQPRKRRWDYYSNEDCTIASFLQESLQMTDVVVGAYTFNGTMNRLKLSDVRIPEWLTDVIREARNHSEDITISALRRALR